MIKNKMKAEEMQDAFDQYNAYEKAVNEIMLPDDDSENVFETEDDSLMIDHQNSAKLCTVSASRKKWINLLEQYAKEYPEEVTIRYRNTNGSILAYMPVTYLHIYRPREYSEEQKKAMRERAEKYFNIGSTSEKQTK